MMEEVSDGLREAGDSKEVRLVVLRGEGKVFSAGHNLKEMTVDTGRQHHINIFKTCESMMKLVTELPVPVLCAVTGHAAAAGCQLVASCDMVIAGPNSKFSTPGASVGLFC